jgi:cardiolipin synthase
VSHTTTSTSTTNVPDPAHAGEPQAPAALRAVSSTLSAAWQKTAKRLQRLGAASTGNELTPFLEGDGAYAAMLSAIEHAAHRVWMETYIFAPDALGQRVLAALTAAAARGVEVKLLVDAVGSSALTSAHNQALRDAGGVVVVFNDGVWSRLWPWSSRERAPRALRNLVSFAVRDHRKILIVDDEHGFCGGMNVSCDYAGPLLGNGLFRDTHVLIGGPAVADLAAVFARSFRHATGQVLPRLEPPAARPSGCHVQILGSDRFSRRRRIQRALHTAVTHASGSICLTTPYFVPPPQLLTALRRAARRGVDVRVLTAGVSDVRIAQAAARHLYASLLDSGVRIYELQRQTLHAKTAAVDDVYAHIGSFNLDRWSYDRNLEVVAMTLNHDMAHALRGVFEHDLVNSTEIHRAAWQQRGLLQRFFDFCAWHLARL